jgi:hypothetical protein
MKVLKYGSTLTKKEFNDFLKKLFAPPPKGSEHRIWYDGKWWRWRTGIAGSLRVKPDGNIRYRKPNEEESRQMDLAFRLLVRREKRPNAT